MNTEFFFERSSKRRKGIPVGDASQARLSEWFTVKKS